MVLSEPLAFAKDPEQLLKFALDCFSAGDFEQAESYATQSISLFNGTSAAYAYAVRGSVLTEQMLIEEAAKDFQQALVHFPFQIIFLQKLSKLAKTGNIVIKDILTRVVDVWLSQRPNDWQLAVILESFRWFNLSTFGVVETTPEGNLKGWVVSPNNTVLLEVDGRVIEHKCDLASPLLFSNDIGNGKNSFHIKLDVPFSNCRLGILGHGSLWGSPIRGMLYFSDANKVIPRSPLLNTNKVETVDILIPVYKGLEDTLRCLNSLYAAQSSNKTAMRIIVINDVSPEIELTEILKSHFAQGLIHLIERPFNVGFVGTINTGLSVDSDKDVILLNADTCVVGNWLDCLHNAAHSASDIATVTPITNNGELLSYPIAMKSNAMPSNEQIGLLDNLFSKFGSKNPLVIPTGVGFCLYIRREVLTKIGGLNEHLIYRGYGDETEFCLRAAAAGWKNVAALNVFVAHKGTVSFGDEKLALARRNNAQIYARYPHHKAQYQDYLRSNFLAELYRDVQRAWLATELPPFQLPLYLQSADDSTQNSALDNNPMLRLELDESTFPVLLKLTIKGVVGLAQIDYRFPEQCDELIQDLKNAAICYFVLCDLARWSTSFIEQLKACFNYQIQLNDEAGYCPRRYALVDGQVRCNEEVITLNTCNHCTTQLGPLVKDYQNVTDWKKRNQRWFEGAASISVSTEALAQRYRKQFCDISFLIYRFE